MNVLAVYSAAKNWKKLLYVFLALLLFPLLIASSGTAVATIPMADNEKIEIYKSVAAAVSASKANIPIDWKALVAIDAVRHNQNLKSVTKSSIEKLANRFVIEESHSSTDSKTGKSSSSTTYRAKPLDDVLNELGFSQQQKKQVQLYIASLSKNEGMGGLDGAGGDFIPLFYQWDSRWGSYPYSSGGIAQTGCGPTCLAMVATGLGGSFGAWDKNGDNILTPDEAANFSTSNGGVVSGDGTIGDVLYTKAATSFGLRTRHYTKGQYSQVFDELKNGYPVIANVHGTESIPYGQPGSTFTQHGHFIVLTGVDETGKIKVNDPNGKLQQSEKTWDWLSIIVAESSDFWAFDNPNIKTDSYYLTFYTNGGGINGGGVTADGTSLVGKDVTIRAIAVDPTQIPLGSLVFIRFPSSSRYITLPNGTKFDKNGVYVARDTGGAIKDKRIDLFIGSDEFWRSVQLSCPNENVSVQIRKK